MSSGIGCGPPSRPPDGSMYAHMWRRSTTPVSSCSAPIGSWTATHRSESCCRAASSTRKKSARSRSSMLTKRTRESSYASARFQTRLVLTSTPMTPLSTTMTPSTTRSAAYVSAWKPASPGVSTRLIFRSFHSRWQSEPARDIARFCSCSSQSETVVPWSIVPSRFVFPAWWSSASTSEVFPTPRCPATAMLRILAGSVAGIGDVSSSVASARIVSPQGIAVSCRRKRSHSSWRNDEPHLDAFARSTRVPRRRRGRVRLGVASPHRRPPRPRRARWPDPRRRQRRRLHRDGDRDLGRVPRPRLRRRDVDRHGQGEPHLRDPRSPQPRRQARPLLGRGALRRRQPRGERLRERQLERRGRGGEVRLDAQDRLRVELGDARLGDAEHLSDLAQGQLLVVVERHDELLALG